MSYVENEYFIQNLRDGLVLHIIKQFFGETDAVNIFGTSYDAIDFTAERDYLHVDDFCNACVNVLPKLLVRGEGVTYTVGSGKQYTIKEVITISEQVFGVKIKTIETPPRKKDFSRL
jgi:UDP-glucose 4-epimerase